MRDKLTVKHCSFFKRFHAYVWRKIFFLFYNFEKENLWMSIQNLPESSSWWFVSFLCHIVLKITIHIVLLIKYKSSYINCIYTISTRQEELKLVYLNPILRLYIPPFIEEISWIFFLCLCTRIISHTIINSRCIPYSLVEFIFQRTKSLCSFWFSRTALSISSVSSFLISLKSFTSFSNFLFFLDRFSRSSCIYKKSK